VTDATVRAFLALEIPDSLRRELAQSRDVVRGQLPRARWVRPEGQHLTLKFLGECGREVLDAMISDLRPRLEGLGPVTVTLSEGGFFPNRRRPRVAWLGGVAEGVEPVVESVEEAAVAHGFPPERRPWSLHLTQARLDRGWPEDAVSRFLEWSRELRLPAFRCDDVVLFSSRLRPGGAVYTPLERMPLR
jgi:2'-5' RNA ligase